MKKYENFSQEILEKICKESESYREVAMKIGYNPDGGSAIKAVKEMIEKYHFDCSHFLGPAHTKNIGKRRVPLEDYLSGKAKITTHKL